ncbi:MAG: molecular chaperone DnaJ [Pseudomonadota bacterium]|nr:molecular chaperone DnaJ [Pseudomonadota bacterium]
MRTVLLLAALASAIPALAQTAPPEPTRIDFSSVAAALKELEARDGNGTVVAHADGWTLINEPLASAQWSFTPSSHYAYPALVRRIIKRSPTGAVSVETASLCEAPQAECSKLLSEFAALNDRITQAVTARGRQGSTQPPP